MPPDRLENLTVDGIDSLFDALAEIARRHPEAPPPHARRSKRRKNRAAHRTVFEMTSTSTVGLPRLSRISRPTMSTMAVAGELLLLCLGRVGGSAFSGSPAKANAGVSQFEIQLALAMPCIPYHEIVRRLTDLRLAGAF
jgi:hypothetical protein